MVRLFIILLLATGLQAQVFNFQDQPFLSQSGVKLTDNLVAAWHLDEQVTSGNRIDAVSGITWYDSGGTIGSLRGVIGGAVSITNGAGNYLTVTNSQFQGTSGFTLAFWVIGANANNSWIGQKKGDGSAADWYVDGSPNFQVWTAVGVAHNINLTFPAGVLWNFVVVGFDGSQIFASINGGAKSTLACPSLQTTANMPFVNRWILGGVDEVNFWNRALSSTEITTLYNSGFGNPYPYTQTDPGVLFESNFGWAVTNAGVTLGNTSSNALVGLIDGCVADGTWSGLSYCLPFAPDSLTAALLPLVAPKAQNQNVSWTYPVNHGFVSGDLTVNGLTADGVGKYLDTGIAGTAFTLTGAGMFEYAYSTTTNSNGSGHMGYLGNTVQDIFQLLPKYNDGNAYWDTWNYTVGQGRISVSSPGPGFYSGQRTAANSSVLYFANSSTAHAALASISTAGGSIEGLSCYIFCLNSAGSASFFDPATISFAGFDPGFTGTQSAKLYNRVQAYRVAAGGGSR